MAVCAPLFNQEVDRLLKLYTDAAMEANKKLAASNDENHKKE